MARTKGAKNKVKVATVKFLVVWSDPQCELFDTMESAKSRVEELINDDGEDANYIYIFPVSDAFKVQATVLTEKVGINSVELG